MKVKQVKTEKEFQPVTIKITFESTNEIERMVSLLSATEYTWDCMQNSASPELEELRYVLNNKLK